MNALPPLAIEILRYFATILTVSAVLVLSAAAVLSLLAVLTASLRRRVLLIPTSIGLTAHLVFASELLVAATVLEILMSPTYLNLAKLAVFAGVRVALGTIRARGG